MVTKSTLDAQSHCGSTVLLARVTTGSSFSTGSLGAALATTAFFSGVVVVPEAHGEALDGLLICSHLSDSFGGSICFTASRRAATLVAPCLM
jgi:hypothetical protein